MSWTRATAAAEPLAAAAGGGGHWPEGRSAIIDWLIGEARALARGPEPARDGSALHELIAAEAKCAGRSRP